MTETVKELEAHAWEDIVVDLLMHAHRRMRRLIWQGSRGASPDGWQAEDVVQEAIAKFIDGSREWNRRRYPSLLKFLSAVVDSEIGHRVQSSTNRKSRTFATLSDGKARALATTADPQVDVEGDTVDAMMDEVSAREILRFEATLDGEPLLRDVLNASLEGDTRARISKKLGLAPAELDNARKRLQRRWAQYIKNRAEKGSS
jgi:DNA-directed RNA polymerase specialized sigma24 family protein